MKASSSKYFSCDTEKNLKDYMAITLQSGKKVEDGRGIRISKNVVNEKAENERLVNEEVANETVENENTEIVEQESQVGKKEEKIEENQSPSGNVLFLSTPFLIVTPLPFP